MLWERRTGTTGKALQMYGSNRHTVSVYRLSLDGQRVGWKDCSAVRELAVLPRTYAEFLVLTPGSSSQLPLIPTPEN